MAEEGASMYDIRLIIGAVAIMAAFGFGFFGGYKLEAGKVAELAAQLEIYRAAAKAADAKLSSTQQEIDAKLAAKDAEFTKKVAAIQQEEADKRQALQKALAEGTTRVAAMKTEMGSLNAKLRDVREQQKNAPAADQAALQAQVEQLTKERKALKDQFRGETCKQFPVPKEIVDSLNGVKS